MRIRWAVRCTATAKSTGLPCQAFAVTGATVCVKHGGATPQVKATARKRWEFELMMRRIERRSPLAAAFMRAEFAPDPATYRSHKSAAERARWTPRFIPVNLDELAREHGRAVG